MENAFSVPALEVERLHASLGKTEIVHGIAFRLEAGELAYILGANGSGKTTTPRSILGLITPTAGAVRSDGSSALGLSDHRRAQIFAYVPPASEPPFPYPVLDVVLLGRTPYLKGLSSPGAADERIALEALERMGIRDLASRPFTELSGGQRQLVLIARALAQQPRILLMDEPTASLDFGNQLKVLHEARALAHEGMAVLMVTHDPDHALAFADHVIALEDGRIVADGKPEEVLTDELLSRIYHTLVHVAAIPGPVGRPPMHVCIAGPDAERMQQ